MKLKQYLASLIVFGVVLAACKKSNNTGGTPAIPTSKPKYLTRIISVSTSPGIGTYTTFKDFTYDAKKRLSTIKDGSTTIIYTYNNDNGNLYAIEDLSNGARFGYNEFTYENGKVKSALQSSYQNNQVSNQIKWDFVYNAKGQVSEAHHEIYYELYEYDSNNNVSKMLTHYTFDYAYNYQYDNKKNKFISSPFNSLLSSSLDPAGDRYSPNNLVTTSSTGLSPDFSDHTTYTYDSDGYPIGGSRGTPDNGSKFTYIYSTLE